MIPSWLVEKLGNPVEINNPSQIKNGFYICSPDSNISDWIAFAEENPKTDLIILQPSRTDSLSWQKLLSVAGYCFLIKGIQKDLGVPYSIFPIGKHGRRALFSSDILGCIVKYTTGIRELALL